MRRQDPRFGNPFQQVQQATERNKLANLPQFEAGPTPNFQQVRDMFRQAAPQIQRQNGIRPVAPRAPEDAAYALPRTPANPNGWDRGDPRLGRDAQPNRDQWRDKLAGITGSFTDEQKQTAYGNAERGLPFDAPAYWAADEDITGRSINRGDVLDPTVDWGDDRWMNSYNVADDVTLTADGNWGAGARTETGTLGADTPEWARGELDSWRNNGMGDYADQWQQAWQQGGADGEVKAGRIRNLARAAMEGNWGKTTGPKQDAPSWDAPDSGVDWRINPPQFDQPFKGGERVDRDRDDRDRKRTGDAPASAGPSAYTPANKWREKSGGVW